MPEPLAKSAAARHRMFFALWPDEAALERLDQAARQLHALGGGRRMRRETLHITLAFIGEVPAERIEDLSRAASEVATTAFVMRLDRLECWRQKRIAWAGCWEAPLQLLTLVGQLHARLGDVGLPLEAGEFTPHLTLLRNVHVARCRPLPTLEPVEWPVTEFALVESRLTPDGARYSSIARWRLD